MAMQDLHTKMTSVLLKCSLKFGWNANEFSIWMPKPNKRKNESTATTSVNQSHHVRARSQPFRSRSNLAATTTNANAVTSPSTTLRPVTLTMQNRRWVNWIVHTEYGFHVFALYFLFHFVCFYFCCCWMSWATTHTFSTKQFSFYSIMLQSTFEKAN